jgi:predicted nucleic acid-binding protein
MLCDSNILIYAADPNDTKCRPFAEHADASIASVSRIEVLGFPGFAALSPDRRSRLQVIVSSMIERSLDENVILRAITLRQDKRMSLGDAVVAATALTHSLPLVTRNVSDFKHIPGLTLIDPFEQGQP